MRVAIYGRVSTSHQVEHQTIEQQLGRLTAHVGTQAAAGWALDPTHVFRDDGFSGAALARLQQKARRSLTAGRGSPQKIGALAQPFDAGLARRAFGDDPTGRVATSRDHGIRRKLCRRPVHDRPARDQRRTPGAGRGLRTLWARRGPSGASITPIYMCGPAGPTGPLRSGRRGGRRTGR